MPEDQESDAPEETVDSTTVKPRLSKTDRWGVIDKVAEGDSK